MSPFDPLSTSQCPLSTPPFRLPVARQPNQINGHRSKSNTHRSRARRAARELLSSIEACLGPVSRGFYGRESRHRTCNDHRQPVHAARFAPVTSQCAAFWSVLVDRSLQSRETFRAQPTPRSGKRHGRHSDHRPPRPFCPRRISFQ